MKTPEFCFESDAANRFATLDEDGNAPTISIDRGQGMLRITLPNNETQNYPLVVDGEPYPQAVYITQPEDLPPMFEIGTVDFCDQAEYLEDYPLNDPQILDVWSLNIEDGGICILDIRNLGRMISTIYAPDKVPIVLSISGIYLRVATLKYFAASGFAPWYQQASIPKP